MEISLVFVNSWTDVLAQLKSPSELLIRALLLAWKWLTGCESVHSARLRIFRNWHYRSLPRRWPCYYKLGINANMKSIKLASLFTAAMLLHRLGEAEDLNTMTVMNDNTAFACDLFGQLRSQPGNLFLSPYSISTALAMAYGGARVAFQPATGTIAPGLCGFTEGFECRATERASQTGRGQFAVAAERL
jgi:hypothetical protein